MIHLSSHVIDVASLLAAVTSPRAGAVVLFLGTTREFTEGRQTTRLHYECYADMATKKLEELERTARDRWPIVECGIHHRLGDVPPGEASVAIAVSTPHRADAFAAGEWLIDELKKVVPIWKKEIWSDGSADWIEGAAP